MDQHWHRALSATSTRPRPFYNCRHAFISFALERGAKIKWLADYVGSSVEMIERHYGKWLQGDDQQLALITGEMESPTPISDRSVGPISGANAKNRDTGRELRTQTLDEVTEVLRPRIARAARRGGSIVLAPARGRLVDPGQWLDRPCRPTGQPPVEVREICAPLKGRSPVTPNHAPT